MASAIRIGDVTVTPLLDGFLDLDAREAVPGVPRTLVAAEAPGLIDGKEQVRLPVIVYLVRSARHLVLIDAGIGSMRRSGWPRGQLDARLREVGVGPVDIDCVVGTHMHEDHIGWNTVGSAESARTFFPKARYVFQAREWCYWIDSGRVNAAGNEHLVDCVASLVGRAEIELVDSDAAITPELRYLPTPGHTPGHAAVVVTSGGERCVVIGDVSHYTAQLRHPEWSPTWDVDPKLAARSRRELFESLEGDPTTLIATSHWAYPGLGRVVRKESGLVYVPVTVEAS